VRLIVVEFRGVEAKEMQGRIVDKEDMQEVADV